MLLGKMRAMRLTASFTSDAPGNYVAMQIGARIPAHQQRKPIMTRYRQALSSLRVFAAVMATSVACSALAFPAHAVVVVPVSGGSKAPAKEEPVVSTGAAFPVRQGFAPQYVPASRTWYDTHGQVLVCPSMYVAGEPSDKFCIGADGKKQSGWTPVQLLKRPGYRLQAMQLNESRQGPSLVLFWMKD